MEKKPSAYPIIAGVVLCVYAVLSLFNGAIGVILALCAAFAAVILFMRKRDLLGAISIGAICAGLVIAALISLGSALIRDIRESYPVNTTSVFFSLLGAGGAALLTLFAFSEFTGLFPVFKQFIKKFWWLPAAIIGACGLFGWLTSGFYGSALIDFFFTLGLSIAVLMIGLWLAYPEALAEPENTRACNGEFGDCRIGLVKHTLLLIFTFGVWQYIWIFRTTKKLNRVAGLPYRSPVKKLLLCLFVPLYVVFWTYKTAQRLDKAAAEKGLPSDMTVVGTLLALLLPPISFIVLQDRLNELATA